MPTIEVNGTQLEYVERGQGDPVVLVHGTLDDYRYWGLQMDAFAETRRTISYSRRYHHPNPCNGDETDYSAALHADDLAAFIAGLGLGSAHVVGNSYGAFTALFLAARHPERVRALVLGEPWVVPLLDPIPEGRALRDDFLANVWEPVREMVQQGELEKGIGLFLDAALGESGAFDRFPSEVREPIMDNACQFKVETQSPDLFTPFTCEDARRVATPTLLLTGDAASRISELIVDELERCLPNNERVMLPHSAHELPVDNPEAYNKIVLDFLAKHSTEDAGP